MVRYVSHQVRLCLVHQAKIKIKIKEYKIKKGQMKKILGWGWVEKGRM